ncbi:caseinolytic protease C [Salpingoeca rosetta]|uniref:Caseinolytic protease C n=1 Tax=Salpingoeca rosetta (strain ATCC 50818 / BSB-021) TaxID=946362 RepID=F2UDV8_SALR5|nr:caseinolytic protease C [Salpingoeca rosetta]EGD74808.1 caseinolytic protease C [Salpingoeca rosetta]|eukprot:XP_004992453.1 caseinolytic protease C [Salpingoeca rosetta]
MMTMMTMMKGVRAAVAATTTAVSAVLRRGPARAHEVARLRVLSTPTAMTMSTRAGAGAGVLKAPLALVQNSRKAAAWGAVASTAVGVLGWSLFGDSNEGAVQCRQTNAPLLCKAAQFNDTQALEKLLQQGADVDDRHQLGWTALHVAAVNGNVDACRVLLEHGASVDLEDEYFPNMSRAAIIQRQRDFSSRLYPHMSTVGMTALHYAALVDSAELVELLIHHSADPNIKDHNECTAIEYTDNEHIKRRLRAYMEEHAALKEERERREAEERAEEAKRRRREFPLEERLHQYVVGQDGPIMAVAAAVRRRENGWHDEDHPLVFLFLGSSGVGKTELAKRLAQYIHHDEKATSNRSKGFIRLDMTEYQEKHEAAKLIGAPPGYVGHDEGGQLTKMLKSCPNAVVLLDEVEKAHPDVLTVMLQLFDEGRLTDGQGKTIDCKDAIFVMTSNLASDVIAEHAWELRKRAEELQGSDEHFSLSKQFKEQIIRPILKAHFKRDEFLGRIDEILYFVPFSKSELNQLVLLELKKWQQRAKERHNMELTWDDAVVQRVAEEYDIHYGARSLQHAVDQLIINRLAAAHEQDKISKGCSVQLFVTDGDVHLNVTAEQTGGALGWLFGSGKTSKQNTSNTNNNDSSSGSRSGADNAADKHMRGSSPSQDQD